MSPTEQRFREAFAAELAADPTLAPGPKALANRMGWTNPSMSGIWSALRIELLGEAGFYKDELTNRWVLDRTPFPSLDDVLLYLDS